MGRLSIQADDSREIDGGTGAPSVSLKRLLEIASAAAALVLLAPVLVVVILCILLEDGGPVLFFQNRLGVNGREFVLYKFRKFRRRHDLAGCPLTLRHDPRLTRVGRILERAKIDEVPQLWNILRGDMSFVGPRPETPNFSDCFQGPYRELLQYRPGIFGPSQAVFRNESAFYESGGDPELLYRAVLFPLKGRLDCAYYSHRSLRLDVKWSVRCVLAVLGIKFLPGPQADPAGQVESCLKLVAAEAKR